MRIEIIGLLFFLLLFILTAPNYLMISSGSSSGITSFIGLSDTPDDYAGNAGNFVKVNSDESGLEFSTISVSGSDTNCSTSPDCNNLYVNTTGDTMTGPLTIYANSTNAFQVLELGGNSIFDVNTTSVNGPVRTRNFLPFTNEGSTIGSESPLLKFLTGYFTNLGTNTTPITNAIFTDANVKNDLNVFKNLRVDNNVYLDGNLFAKDANTFIGDPTSPGNDDIIFYGSSFNCYGSTWEGCLSIPSNSFAFKVRGSGDTGIDFNGTGRFIGMLNSGALTHLFGVSGNSNGLQWMAYQTSLTKTWAGTPSRRPGTLMDYNGGGNGTWPALMIDENGTGNYVSVGSHLIYNDLNADKNAYIKGTLFGERVVVDSGAGQSCHTEATNWNATMTDINWVCIAVLDHATGSASTCTATTSLRDCMLISRTK